MNTDEAKFLEDVAQHHMKVLLDNGIYRHLRFASTGEHSWNQWFEIVTWPGRLAYSGDMGTFVFARLEDMFAFFRGRPSDHKGLYINLGYWAEKLEAVDRCGGRPSGAMQFSEELFRKRVKDEVKSIINSYSLTRMEAKAVHDAVYDEVLSAADGGEHEAYRALHDFSVTIADHKIEFHDTWEWNIQEYTGRFIWCCYALAWAIQQYDARPSHAV